MFAKILRPIEMNRESCMVYRNDVMSEAKKKHSYSNSTVLVCFRMGAVWTSILHFCIHLKLIMLYLFTLTKFTFLHAFEVNCVVFTIADFIFLHIFWSWLFCIYNRITIWEVFILGIYCIFSGSQLRDCHNFFQYWERY